MKNINIELSKLSSVDFLYSDLIENFGFDKAKKLISQANDLQKMNGKNNYTMPIIFTGTGGLALISIDSVRKETCFESVKGNQVLIVNPKRKLFQILLETK